MAGLNLCLVANRVLELLRSDEIIRESGLVGSDECRKMEVVISGLSPLLLDAERRSFESDQARDLFKKLGRSLCDFEKLPEALKSFESDEVRDLLRELGQTLDGFENLPEELGYLENRRFRRFMKLGGRVGNFLEVLLRDLADLDERVQLRDFLTVLGRGLYYVGNLPQAFECCESDKIRNWVRDFGRLLYDVENRLEAVKMFSDEALKKRRSRPWRKNMLKKAPEKIIDEASLYYIRYLRRYPNEADRIEKQRHNLNLVKRNEKEIQVPAKVRAGVAKGLSFVNGWASIMDKDKMEIMKILLDKNEAFDVLFVVGDPNLGKMILERYVINDISVQSHFDVHLWNDIPVSFEESSHGKRWLIVIELADTHSEGLNFVARSLRNGPPGSIILVITPSSSLNEEFTGTWKEYQLECLSEEESWELFKKMVFQQGEEPIPNSHLETIGREVAKSYKEHPQAIIAIGSILSCKDYSEEERLIFDENKLKILILDEMMDLEYISSNNSPTEVCPSLQQLWLTELPKLKSWWKTNDTTLASFPCLSRLVIEDCPYLTSMPLFPTLEEGLVLDSTSWELFEKTVNQKEIIVVEEASSSSSNSPPLSKLKNLCIVGINNFDDSKASKIPWDTLKSLRLLKFDFLPKTTTLPHNLQRVTGLQELHIWRSGTKEIPEWIGELKLLERLVIRACPKIKQLPTSISSLQKLQRLEIEGCPTLLRRCEKDVGADWSKILPIPIKQFEGISVE